MLRNLIASAIMISASSALVAQTAPPLPKDAESLRKAYHDARQRALQPLDVKYKAELEKLLAAHTKAGHLDDALAIRTELDSLTANDPTSAVEKPNNRAARLKAELNGTIWTVFRDGKTITVTFDPEGALKQDPSPNAGFPAAWTVNDDAELVLDGRKATTKDKFKTFTVFFGTSLIFTKK